MAATIFRVANECMEWSLTIRLNWGVFDSVSEFSLYWRNENRHDLAMCEPAPASWHLAPP